MKPLLVTSGEPAGIGPELCLDLASKNLPVVVLCDRALMLQRAKLLDRSIELIDYHEHMILPLKQNQLAVIHKSCPTPSIPGQLNTDNASYVLDLLDTAMSRCLANDFSAMITAPIHKAVINQAGISFSGHTEYLAKGCGVPSVVMMLVCPQMRVALLTTHIPLSQVPQAITPTLLSQTLDYVHDALITDFGINKPSIAVAGLNPHAGESGYLGREELDVIAPVIQQFQKKGLNIQGPFAADTMFTPKKAATIFDAYLAMYHDQGLPVLKYAGFGQAVNVTLGLPIIRTSVDHGTALELAGTGQADSSSLIAAVELAVHMKKNREIAQCQK